MSVFFFFKENNFTVKVLVICWDGLVLRVTALCSRKSSFELRVMYFSQVHGENMRKRSSKTNFNAENHSSLSVAYTSLYTLVQTY